MKLFYIALMLRREKILWRILAMYLFSVIGGAAIAQSNVQAFEHLNLGLSVQHNSNRNHFHDYWSPNPALQLDVETPFYVGDFFLAGRYTSFSNLDNDLPDFSNIQANVGWGIKFPVVNRLNIGAKTSVLFSMMSFKNVSDEHQQRAEKRFGSTSPESEIGFLIGANISYEINEKWSLQLLWNRNIIYTRNKMKLNYIGIGFSRRFISPNWLREILE